MPMIRSSADLRNKYNEISTFCHQYREPVFITKNGAGDLVVMSMETFEYMNSRTELYTKIMEGLNDVREGRVRPFDEAMKDTRKEAGL